MVTAHAVQYAMAGKFEHFEEDSSLSVVLQQCNDLVAVQNGLIAKLKQQVY